MNTKIFSNTMPELSELEELKLELSKTINWLNSQVEFYKSMGKDVTAFAFECRLNDVMFELEQVEKIQSNK